MFKKLLSFFIILSMTIVLFTGLPISVSAAADESDFTFNSDTGAITGYNGAGGDVVIPATIGGVEVTSINHFVFQNCSSLTSIIMPDSVTSIGNFVFASCSNLKSVTISNNLTAISQYAFQNCSSLESITIPNSVTNVGNYAFENCSKLKSVKMPSSVTSIGNYVFRGCQNLEIIILNIEAYHRNINIPSATIRIEYSVNDGKINVTNIVLGSKTSVTITDDMDIDYVDPNQRNKVTESGHTHKGGTATCISKAKCDICDTEHGDLGPHTYENDKCTVCGESDPNAGTTATTTDPDETSSTGSSSAETDPTATEPTGTNPAETDPTATKPTGSSPVGTAPVTPSRPSTPSNPSKPSVTTTVTVTVTTAEEIIADGDYTGEDVSAGAGVYSDIGITDSSMVLIVIAIASVIVCAVIIKKIVF